MENWEGRAKRLRDRMNDFPESADKILSDELDHLFLLSFEKGMDCASRIIGRFLTDPLTVHRNPEEVIRDAMRAIREKMNEHQ